MLENPDYLRSPTCWFLFFSSLFLAAAITPLIIRFARRVGAVDAGGHRKISARSMPLLGGLAILVPFVGVCLMGVLGASGMFTSVSAMRHQFLMLGLGAIAIAALGVYDDVRGLRARYKLLGQIAVALLVVSTGDLLESIRLPLLGVLHLDSGFAVLIGTLWIVGLINAINIIDGIDGLATTVSLIAVCGLIALGAIGQQTFALLVCISLAGSLLGFLPYNFYPARIFLGDTGSMLLGYALGSVTLISTHKSETAVIVIAPLLALGFPIFETLVSMGRRMLRGAPIFGADDRHTHHRLLSRGYSQRMVVLLLCGVSGILTSVAIMSRIVPKQALWEWILLAVVAVTLIGTGWLAGYMRTVPVRTVLRRRQRNAVIHAFANYAALSLSARRPAWVVEEILQLCRVELGLCYLAVGAAGGPTRVAVGSRVAGDGERERLRVQSVQGLALLVEYEFKEPEDEETRRDVAGCLAQLFERADLDFAAIDAASTLPPVEATEARHQVT